MLGTVCNRRPCFQAAFILVEEGRSKGTDGKLGEDTRYGAVRSKVNGEENGMEAGMLAYPK